MSRLQCSATFLPNIASLIQSSEWNRYKICCDLYAGSSQQLRIAFGHTNKL